MRDPLPEARGRAALRVIGVGNAFRRDDAAGLLIARRLRGTLPEDVDVFEREGEPAGLIDSWEGADGLWLVDAFSSGAPPGTVHRVDAGAGPLPAELFGPSTHIMGLGEAIELARALGRLPGRTIVYGIEGASFAAGEGLTATVEAAAERVADAVRTEITLAREVAADPRA